MTRVVNVSENLSTVVASLRRTQADRVAVKRAREVSEQRAWDLAKMDGDRILTRDVWISTAIVAASGRFKSDVVDRDRQIKDLLTLESMFILEIKQLVAEQLHPLITSAAASFGEKLRQFNVEVKHDAENAKFTIALTLRNSQIPLSTELGVDYSAYHENETVLVSMPTAEKPKRSFHTKLEDVSSAISSHAPEPIKEIFARKIWEILTVANKEEQVYFRIYSGDQESTPISSSENGARSSLLFYLGDLEHLMVSASHTQEFSSLSEALAHSVREVLKANSYEMQDFLSKLTGKNQAPRGSDMIDDGIDHNPEPIHN